MRSTFLIAGLLAAGAAHAADAVAQQAPSQVAFEPVWVTTLNTEARYFEFNGTKGQPTGISPAGSRGKASQFYLPFALSIAGNPSPDLKLELTARGGYVDSRQTTFGLSGAVQHTVDSQISGTATYLGIDGIQPFVSFNLNLPTGQTYLAGSRFLARLDADLVDVPTFGEGFNWGATLGANVPLGETMMFTLSGGFTERGPYTREGAPDPITGIDARLRTRPGTSGSLTASLAYQEGAVSGNLAALYNVDGSTSVDGIPTLKTGNRFGLSAALAYAWSDAWTTTLNGSYTHSERNFLPNPLLIGLVPETRNSNSNLFRVGIETLYRTGSWALGPTASYMYRDKNSYSPVTLQFLPARERYAAGGVVQYAVTDTVSLNLRVERIFVREETNPDKVDPIFGFVPGSGQPRLSYNGWSIGSGATVRF